MYGTPFYTNIGNKYKLVWPSLILAILGTVFCIPVRRFCRRAWSQLMAGSPPGIFGVFPRPGDAREIPFRGQSGCREEGSRGIRHGEGGEGQDHAPGKCVGVSQISLIICRLVHQRGEERKKEMGE